MLTDDEIDKYLDDVLRASGSALKHYSMHSTKEAMRAAMRAIERAAAERMRERCRAVCDEAENAGYSVEWLLVAIREIKVEGVNDADR